MGTQLFPFSTSIVDVDNLASHVSLQATLLPTCGCKAAFKERIAGSNSAGLENQGTKFHRTTGCHMRT